MKGLCHFCFKSNVNLSITRGKVWCDTCKDRNVPWPEKETKKEKETLNFSEAAIATLPERTKHLEQVMADLKEKWFGEMMDRERLSEPLIDRIHDT
jgi:hypothetical protein